MNTAIEQQADIYTVSRLNREVKTLLEDHFSTIWIEGELSNFAAPHSGHWYFSLKDAHAQVRCAMFRSHQQKLNGTPKDGMHVLLQARISMYLNRGEFQLIVEDMEERGEGQLRRAYEALKKKLATAGLFDAAHKKPLPPFPTCIGVITSPTGAAIRDILTVLKRRFPCVPVIIYPTLVQGETAAPNIIQAIQTANHRNECNVIILARGGGSLEDLWCFNNEAVAHAIHQSALPIISGVGHEVDFTIADFVADCRAPTPSAAAEIATPDQMTLRRLLARHQQQIIKQIQQTLSSIQQQLYWVKKHLYQQHPKQQLNEKMQRLDFFELTLIQLQQHKLNQLQTEMNALNIRLQKHAPYYAISHLQNQLDRLAETLKINISQKISQQQARLLQAAATLDTLSPLATLKRGYAIATHLGHQQVLRHTSRVNIGDRIQIRLAKGIIQCVVEKINPSTAD